MIDLDLKNRAAWLSEGDKVTAKIIPVVKNGLELVQAFKEIGFAAIDPKDWDNNYDRYSIVTAFAVAEEFFGRPQEYKEQFNFPNSGGQIGYTRFGTEKAKDQVIPDLKEFFHVPNSRRVQKELFFSGKEGVSEIFLPILNEAYLTLEQLGLKLLTAIAKELKISNLNSVIYGNLWEHNSILRVLHYPPTGDNPTGVRAAEHEDINLITLLPAASASGLQVKSIDGHLIEAPTDRNLIICNVGDMLQELTGGSLKSTTHRVVNTEEGKTKSRYSLPFFFHPADDFRLSERYTAGEYLEERLKEIGLK